MYQLLWISLGAGHEGREGDTGFDFHKLFDSPSETLP